jgi:exosortase A
LSISSSSTPVCTAEPSLGERYQASGVWIRPLVGLALAGLVTIFLLRATAGSMVSIWYGSRTYSYGFVVVPISAFLVWRRRTELKSVHPTASFIGLALVLLFAVIWLGANVADVRVVQQFALVGLVVALVWTFLGTQAVRVLGLALLFLFFAVPAGESLVGPLQQFTAAFTVNALRFSGIPAVQDGLVLSTPSGDWKVAEACSGVRYLTSSIVVGVLFAGVAFHSWKRRIVFVLISGLVPILANAVRAYLIVALAYLTNNRMATGVDHVIYGWVFFSLVTALVISLALGWHEPEVRRAQPARSSIDPPLAPILVTRLLWWMAIVILIVVSASSTADFLWSRTPPNQLATKLWSGPPGWLEAADADHDWAPNFETIESETSETFRDGSREVSLYTATYPAKRRGMELVNSSNAVGAPGEWDLVGSDKRVVVMGGRSVKVAEYVLASGGQLRIVWMWYLTDDHLTASPYRIKALQAESRLFGRPQNVSLFAISARSNSGPSQAIGDLSDFLRGMTFPRRPSNIQ